MCKDGSDLDMIIDFVLYYKPIVYIYVHKIVVQIM